MSHRVLQDMHFGSMVLTVRKLSTHVRHAVYWQCEQTIGILVLLLNVSVHTPQLSMVSLSVCLSNKNIRIKYMNEYG
jgi:hypothetical protein